MRAWSILAAAGLLSGLSGCTTVVVPPERPGTPAPVYIVDYGYHASLVTPAGDGGSTEYAFGEWGWYAAGERAWWRTPGILLAPSDGALGRRSIAGEPDAAGLRAETGAVEVLEVVVDAADLARWRGRMEAEFARRRGELGSLLNPAHGMEFVPHERSYWTLHTCNAAVAEWLRELGCETRGWTVDADFEVRPRPGAAPRRRRGGGGRRPARATR